MFLNNIFFSLLASKLYLSSATVSGTTVTISDSSDFTNDNTISLIIDNKATTLKLSGSLTAMPKFKGYTLVKNVVIEAAGITEIPEKCFYQNSHIETVILHSGVTAIRNYAFTYSSIRTINLENVESIGHYAFQKCSNLKVVNFQKISYIGVGPFFQSGIEILSISVGVHFIIQRGSFQNCFFLKSVSFSNTASDTDSPRSVQILDYAFMNCHQLKTITTKNLLINAYDYTFANTALETFPFESLSTVGSYTFLNTKLKSVAPTSATTSFVGSRMTFRFCFYIQTVDLSNVDGNYTNSYGMFFRCSSLTTVKLPVSMTILPESMFKDCQALTSISAPGLSEISTDGFMSCTSLETIDIGSSSITKIGYRGIHNCPKLNLTIQNVHLDERAIYANNVIESISVSYLSYWSCMNMTNLKSVTIRSNQYEIPVGCFMYCTKLETVNIPITATYIGDLCFAFTNLKNVLDLNRVYRLRDYAFWRSNLTGIKINTDMDRFGYQCFYECPNLVTIYFTSRVQNAWMYPFFGNSQKFEFITQSSYVTWDSTNKILRNRNSVIYVAPDATLSNDFFLTNDFEVGSLYWYKQPLQVNAITSHNYILANSSITSITFTDDPSRNNYILQDMSYSTELTTVQLSPGITEIGSGCFKGCTKLKTINLGDVKKIDEGAFIGCTSLDNIDISKVTYLMPEAFMNCVSLEKVNFPVSLVDGRDSNSQIGINFFGNTGFTEITFATAIQQPSFFKGMFVGCKKLRKVTFGPGISKVPDHMFENSSLVEFEYSSSLTSIGNMSFARTNLNQFTISANLNDIYPTAFYGSFNINIIVSSENTKYEIIDGNHLVEKSTKSLVCLFGKIPNTFKLSEEIRVLKDASLASAPNIDANTGKVIDWGITTLIIPGNIRVEDKTQPLRYTPYLHNLCYGGIDQPPLLNSMAQRYFVTSNYSKDFWVLSEEGDMDNENYIGVIRAPCSNFTPYEKFNQREFDNLYDCPVDEITEETPTDPPLSQTDLDTSKKLTGLLIALIVLAVIETILVCVISLYMYYAEKNKDSSSEEEDGIEMKEETVLNSFSADETNFNIMIDSPIFNKGFQNESDPFAGEFDEKDETKEDHFLGNRNLQEH